MPTMTQRKAAARRALTAYCNAYNLPRIERSQDYTFTDLITDLLHLAAARGCDTIEIRRQAADHFHAETIESCPKCGARIARENAHQDEGERDEAGRTFYYCSEECRESH
jgi:YHS domain-containing protein